jgi:hypothetical protein
MERFRQIIIGTTIERFDKATFVCPAGEYDDVRVRIPRPRPYALADLSPVRSGVIQSMMTRAGLMFLEELHRFPGLLSRR